MSTPWGSTYERGGDMENPSQPSEVHVVTFVSAVDGSSVIGAVLNFKHVHRLCEHHLKRTLPSFKLLNFRCADASIQEDVSEGSAMLVGWFPVVYGETDPTTDPGATATLYQVYSVALAPGEDPPH
jgi:hypothetical protein